MARLHRGADAPAPSIAESNQQEATVQDADHARLEHQRNKRDRETDRDVSHPDQVEADGAAEGKQ